MASSPTANDPPTPPRQNAESRLREKASLAAATMENRIESSLANMDAALQGVQQWRKDQEKMTRRALRNESQSAADGRDARRGHAPLTQSLSEELMDSTDPETERMLADLGRLKREREALEKRIAVRSATTTASASKVPSRYDIKVASLSERARQELQKDTGGAGGAAGVLDAPGARSLEALRAEVDSAKLAEMQETIAARLLKQYGLDDADASSGDGDLQGPSDAMATSEAFGSELDSLVRRMDAAATTTAFLSTPGLSNNAVDQAQLPGPVAPGGAAIAAARFLREEPVSPSPAGAGDEGAGEQGGGESRRRRHIGSTRSSGGSRR